MENRDTFEKIMLARLAEGEAEMQQLQNIAAAAQTNVIARKLFCELSDALRASAETQLAALDIELAAIQTGRQNPQASAERLEILLASPV